MKTKRQIISEINGVPEILQEFREHAQAVLEESGIQIDPYDIVILLSVFLERFGLWVIRSAEHEKIILDQFRRFQLVKPILKKHPELDFTINTMPDPETGICDLAIGLDFHRK